MKIQILNLIEKQQLATQLNLIVYQNKNHANLDHEINKKLTDFLQDKTIVKQFGASNKLRELEVQFLQPSNGEKYHKGNKLRIDPFNFTDWLSLDENIVSYDKKDSESYDRKRFQLVSYDDYQAITDKLIKKYEDSYYHESLWCNGIPPLIDEDNDPVFIQKIKIPASSKIYLIGDLHSSLTSLIKILKDLTSKKVFKNNDSFKMNPNNYLVFLGDIVDRGPYGIELMTLISKIKLDNFSQVYIVNGNHEDFYTFKKYGYFQEILGQFNDNITDKYDPSEIREITKLMHYLPSAIFADFDGNRYQFCHGSMTEDSHSVQKLLDHDHAKFRFIDYKINGGEKQKGLDSFKWADMTNLSGKFKNKGRGPLFGADKILEYNRELGIDAIISGHQDKSNLTFIFNPNAKVDETRFENDPNYHRDENHRVHKKMVMYRPKDYELLLGKKNLKYTPGRDFIALNTSSCYQSKGDGSDKNSSKEDDDRHLMYDCYLILQ